VSDDAQDPKAAGQDADPGDEAAAAERPAASSEESPTPAAEAEGSPAAKAPAAEAEEAPVASEVLGCLVEFETEASLMAACEKVRDAGYSEWDAHTPYPVHGLDGKMGIKPTILPWIVLGGGLTGCLLGLIMQSYTNGIVLPFSLADNPILDPFLPSGYPFVVSGKPIHSVPASIPVAFELTILLSAFGAFFGMWLLNRLPQFYHPVFNSQRFRRATQDRFFISIEAKDALWDAERTLELARALGGTHVEALLGEEAQ